MPTGTPTPIAGCLVHTDEDNGVALPLKGYTHPTGCQTVHGE